MVSWLLAAVEKLKHVSKEGHNTMDSYSHLTWE